MGKNVHEQVKIFNQTILNIFRSFIPNKTTLYDARGTPRMNIIYGPLNKKRNYFYRSQRKSINFNYIL